MMKTVVGLFALGIALLSGSVSAEHQIENDRAIRVHMPLHVHGPERLSLGRLINRHRRINLDNYVLKAVVVQGSQGHTRLSVGRYSSPTVHLDRRNVRIPAPARYGDHWRLHLSRDANITAVTAILEPRPRLAYRGYAKPGFDIGWLWQNDRYNNHEYRGPRRYIHNDTRESSHHQARDESHDRDQHDRNNRRRAVKGEAEHERVDHQFAQAKGGRKHH